MGRFSLDLVAQRATLSPVDVNVKKGELAIPLHLHGELHITVKAFQIV